MKKLLLISAIASLAAFCSCSNEDENLGANQVYDKVVATIESDGSSRTTMNGTYVNWVKDDQIGIFFQNGDNKAYTLVGDGGSTSGEFGVETPIEEGMVKVLAYYPYSTDATYTDEVLNINLEAEHTYSAASNNGFPMIAKIGADSQGKIQFKNAGAILAVTVKNLPAEYTYVTLSAADNDSKIAGKAKIAYDNEGQPKLEIVEDNSNSSTIKIKLAENRTEAIEECTFYFPLPVANYSKLTFSLHKSESDEPVVGKEKALNAARNMRYNATLVFDKVSTDIVAETTSTSAATEALSNGASSVQVSVAADEDNPTITLPSSDEGASVNLYFDKIEATTAITIAETSDATTNAAVTIAAPESDGDTNNNNFNIELPNSTVTLAANGESATYNEVTAATAENTLIISEGVTVKTLKVKKGHVRVHGKIDAISYEGENSETIYIIKEEGATIPETTTGFVVMSAAEWDLRKAIAEGGTVTLASDIDLALTTGGFLTIESDKSVSIDLNGKTLTTSNTSVSGSVPVDITVKGELSIKNGTIKTANTGLWTDGGKLTLLDCTIESQRTGASTVGGKNSSTLIIENCTANVAGTAFKAKGGSSMTLTNCTATTTSTSGAAVVTIDGSNSTLTISGGSYTGAAYTGDDYDKYVIGVKNGASATINTTVSGGNGGVTVLGSTATLTGGNYTGMKACGLYVGDNSTVTYSNCTFSGVEGDVVAKNGTVNGVVYTEYTNMQQVSSVDDLKTVITNGGTVTLASDIDLALTTGGFLTIESDKSVSIDLNGKTLTTSNTSVSGSVPVDITVKGELSIKNGTIKTANTGLWTDGGKLTLLDCTIESQRTGASTVGGKNSSTLIIENCTANVAGTAFKAKGGSSMTLTNCTATTTSTSGAAVVTIDGSNSTLTISGGSYTGAAYTGDDYDKYVIGVKNGASATINTTVSGGNGGVTVLGSTATLTGGNYTGMKACGLYVGDNSTVTYSNCTFSGVEGDVVAKNGTVNNQNYSEYTKIQ